MVRDAHLDTKATTDFISNNLVELLGHNIEEYKGGQISTAASLIKPVGQVSLIFEWQGARKVRKRKFLVVNGLPYDIILGIHFISEFEVYSVGDTLLTMALSPLKKGMSEYLQDFYL